MRISDWSSDVCSSDLQRYSRSRRAPGKEDEGQLEDAHAVEAAQQRRPFGPLSEVSPQHQIEQGAAHQGGKAHQQGNGDAVPDLQAVGRNFRSEEHTSELQSLMRISYAVFCLKKKNTNRQLTKNSPT